MNSIVKNLYYYDEKVIDLNKLREDAARAANGDIRNEARPATIHYHSSTQTCGQFKHEYFPVNPTREDD